MPDPTPPQPDDLQRWPLPQGWRWMRLGEVAHIEMGQSPVGEATNGEGVGYPLLGGASDLGSLFPQPSRHTSAPTKLCRPGDVILCIRATIGRTNFADAVYCLGRGVAGLRSENVEHKFLAHYLDLQEDLLTSLGTGTTFKQINKDTLSNFEIPVPPLDTQRQLVAKIEALFERVAKARAALDAVPQLLEQLRQSVLAAAFRGDLTRAWREANPDAEPAEALLERIRAERRARFIEDYATKKLDKLRAKGPIKPADEPKLLNAARSEAAKKYKQPDPISEDSLAQLPELPQGWCWEHLELVFNWSNGKLLNKDLMNHKGLFTVYGGNGVIGQSDVMNAYAPAIVIGRVGAQCGNVSITLSNAWVTDNAIFSNAIYDNHEVIEYYLYNLKQKNLNSLSGGSGQPFVTQSLLSALPIPFTCHNEMLLIASQIRNWLNTIKNISHVLNSIILQLDQLEQSILSKAFRGELVEVEAAVERAEAASAAVVGAQGSLFEL